MQGVAQPCDLVALLSRPAILPSLLVSLVVCACWGLDGWMVSLLVHRVGVTRWCLVGAFVTWPMVVGLFTPWTSTAQGSADERLLAWALGIFLALAGIGAF